MKENQKFKKLKDEYMKASPINNLDFMFYNTYVPSYYHSPLMMDFYTPTQDIWPTSYDTLPSFYSKLHSTPIQNAIEIANMMVQIGMGKLNCFLIHISYGCSL